jgi:hypothetical protein
MRRFRGVYGEGSSEVRERELVGTVCERKM